jgi:hypothetical protein
MTNMLLAKDPESHPGESIRAFRRVHFASGIEPNSSEPLCPCEAPNQSLAVRPITVTNVVAWRFIPARSGQSTDNPIGTRMFGHAQP